MNWCCSGPKLVRREVFALDDGFPWIICKIDRSPENSNFYYDKPDFVRHLAMLRVVTNLWKYGSIKMLGVGVQYIRSKVYVNM